MRHDVHGWTCTLLRVGSSMLSRYHGTGRLSQASGSVYEGCFHDGKRQGQGRYDCAITGESARMARRP